MDFRSRFFRYRRWWAIALGLGLSNWTSASCDSSLALTTRDLPLVATASGVPLVDRATLAEALEFLHASGCTQVLLQASQVRNFLFQPLVFIKLAGLKGEEKIFATFAFKARKFFTDGTMSEVYDARGPAHNEFFSDVTTVMSRDAGDTMTIGMWAVREAPLISAERNEYLKQKIRNLLK